MKTVLLWWLLALPVSAQVFLYGTNQLVDFSAALKAGPASAYSNYWVVGTVKEKVGVLPLVSLARQEVRFFYDPPPRKITGDNWDLLSLRSAKELQAKYPDGLGLAQYLAMTPTMAENFRPHPVADLVCVLNATNATVGQSFERCALPVPSFKVPGRGPGKGFDCGVPFTGAITTNHQLLVATPTGLVRKKPGQ